MDEGQYVRNLVLSYCDLKQNGSLPNARAAAQLATIDANIYLYGGVDENNIYADIYSLELAKVNWEVISASGFVKPKGRYGHTLNPINKDLIVFGGYEDETENENNTNISTPPFVPKNAKNWAKIGTPSNSVFIFNTNQKSWEEIETSGTPPTPRGFHASTVVKGQNNSFFLVHGGCLDSNYTTLSDDLYVLDLTNFHWSKIHQEGDIPGERFGHIMVAHARRGVVYMFGGAEDGGSLFTLNIIELLTQSASPQKLIWRKESTDGTSPVSRSFHSLNLIGDRLFLFSGITNSENSDLYIYETTKNRWSRPLYDGIINYRAHSATSFFDKLIIFGGTQTSNTNKLKLILNEGKTHFTQKLFFLNVLELKRSTTDDGFKFKLVTVGDSGVGKSCLLNRFVKDIYSDSHKATLGVDFTSVTTMIRGKRCTLQLWDTAGQERFGGVTGNYYRNADGFIVVYDATSRSSFEHINNWIKQIKEYHAFGEDVITLLLGNKHDLYDQIEVTEEEAKQCAESINAIYVSTSAKHATNVDPAFLSAANQLVDIRTRSLASKTIQTPQNTNEVVHTHEIQSTQSDSNCVCGNIIRRRNRNQTGLQVSN